jgi:hypothetical protein
MQHFTYHYKGERFESTAKLYEHEDSLRYMVILPEGLEIGIAPVKHPTQDIIFWGQATRLTEMILPWDMIQSMGEGLEKAIEESANS